MHCSVIAVCTGWCLPLVNCWQNILNWLEQHRIALLCFAAGILLSVVLAGAISFIVRKIIKALIGKTTSGIDDLLVDSLHRPLVAALVLVGTLLSCRFLSFNEPFRHFIGKACFLTMSCCVLWGLLRMVNVLREFFVQLAKKRSNVFDELLVGLVSPALKAVVWVIALLFISENVFGFNIGTLLAGAGVAAMAIAFAAQNTIANLFGAISLIVDRPFVIGDTIVVNGRRGSVKTIGLRSCRVRSLDGTEWIIPNKEMAEATIENISRRPNIKQVFDIGVTYSTTPEQLRLAISIVRDVLENHPLSDMANTPPVISFESMRDSSLNIQAVQWFNTNDFGAFVKAREEVNFAILQRFNENGLEMAFPSQTIYLAKN